MARKTRTSKRGIILDNNNEVEKKLPVSHNCEIIVPHFQLIDPLKSFPKKKEKKKPKTVGPPPKALKKSKSKKKEDDDYLSELENFTDYVESSSYCGGLAFRNTNGESDNSDNDDDDNNNSDSDFNAVDDGGDDEEIDVENELHAQPNNHNNRKSNLTNSETGLILPLETHANTDNTVAISTDTINTITVYCPHPGPKALVKKTKFSNALQGNPQEVTKMVQLLRTRTTLCPLTEHDHSDANEKKQVLHGTLSMIQTGNQSQNWSNMVLQTVQQEPHKLIAENFSQFLEDDLVTQAEKEFLYWSFLPDEERNNLNRYPYWISLLKKSAETHPLWHHYSKHQVEIMITSGGIAALRIVSKQSETANKLVTESLNWINSIEEGMKKTLLFMKKFRVLEAEIESKHKNLDEFCHWGKKHLQEMFSPPYFTLSSSDYCHLVDQGHFLENFFDDAIIDVCKQKWTNKDFRSLQKFIKDVIIDAEYAKYVDRYNYLASRILFERVQRLQEEEERKKALQVVVSSSSYPTPEILGLDELGQSQILKKQSNSRRKKQKVADCEHAKTTLQRHFKVTLDDSNASLSTVEINANITVKAQDLQAWFHCNESRLRKLTYETLMKEPHYVELIDWYKVAKKVSIDSGKDRSANDCFLAWNHEAHPLVNTRRWSGLELKKLIDTVQLKLKNEGVIDWNEIAFIVGNNRTPYQCFFKYRNRVVQNQIMTWDNDKTQNAVDIIINGGAKWRNAVEVTQDVRATKHQVQERWKKTSNPSLRHGAFTRVEDALLLLQIEKLHEFLKRERNFGILISYLPWRFETVWRDRANHLFSNWIVPWTKEEDVKLMSLAASQTGKKKDWQQISAQFSSFKNRKGCLTRHKILNKRIGPGKEFQNLDEYHESYSMFRKNVFQYKHLQEAVDLLKRVMGEEHFDEPFPGLDNTRPPEEWELRYMLLDYDRNVMQKTIQHLELYIKSRNEYWKEWLEKNIIIKTFDRRTFHPEIPQSVASAVHIRGLKLKNKLEIGRNLTEFEDDVYKFYARFCRTKPVNKETERRYLPTAKELSKMPEIKDIVEKSSDMDEESSSNEDGDQPLSKRKRGRPTNDANNVSKVAKQKKVLNTKTKPTDTDTKLDSIVVKRVSAPKIDSNNVSKVAKQKKVLNTKKKPTDTDTKLESIVVKRVNAPKNDPDNVPKVAKQKTVLNTKKNPTDTDTKLDFIVVKRVSAPKIDANNVSKVAKQKKVLNTKTKPTDTDTKLDSIVVKRVNAPKNDPDNVPKVAKQKTVLNTKKKPTDTDTKLDSIVVKRVNASRTAKKIQQEVTKKAGEKEKKKKTVGRKKKECSVVTNNQSSSNILRKSCRKRSAPEKFDASHYPKKARLRLDVVSNIDKM